MSFSWSSEQQNRLLVFIRLGVSDAPSGHPLPGALDKPHKVAVHIDDPKLAHAPSLRFQRCFRMHDPPAHDLLVEFIDPLHVDTTRTVLRDLLVGAPPAMHLHRVLHQDAILILDMARREAEVLLEKGDGFLDVARGQDGHGAQQHE